MSAEKGIVTRESIQDIADAIRGKNGSSDKYRPGDMAAAISALDTSGIHPAGTKQITQNGVADVTEFASANVNVQPNLQSKTATENGTVTPDTGYDGLSSVVVNVSGGSGSSFVVPDYQGLAYSYIATNGQYFQSNEGKKYYSSYFHVISGKTYAIFVGTTVSNRLRAHFYAGKLYSDFEQYVETSGDNQPIYTSTYNITGTSDLANDRLKERFIYTPNSDGELVLVTSNTSVIAPAYCVELT